jgi:hypothetical protein
VTLEQIISRFTTSPQLQTCSTLDLILAFVYVRHFWYGDRDVRRPSDPVLDFEKPVQCGRYTRRKESLSSCRSEHYVKLPTLYITGSGSMELELAQFRTPVSRATLLGFFQERL